MDGRPSIESATSHGEYRDGELPQCLLPTNTRRSSVLFGDAAMPQKKGKGVNVVEHVTAPRFWFGFRSHLNIIVPVCLILAFALAWVRFDDHEPTANNFLISGSALSLLSTLMVILSYVHVCPWRRHPSSLILFRTIVNFVFSGLVLSNATLGTDKEACRAMSFLNQFTLFAGELWVLTISIDLITSMTNPFSSYQSNLQKYHYGVWICAIVNASALICERGCQGASREGFCWIAENATVSSLHFRSCLWGFFLSWSLVFYLTALVVIYIAYRRLSCGLESTYITREAVMYDTFRVIFCYITYAFVLGMFFVCLEFIIPRDETATRIVFEKLFAFVIACRGFVDSLVWFYMHKFTGSRKKSSRPQFLLLTYFRQCLFSDKDSNSLSTPSSPGKQYERSFSALMFWKKSSLDTLASPLVPPTSFDDGTNTNTQSLTASGGLRESMGSPSLSFRSSTGVASGHTHLSDEDDSWQPSDIDLTPQLNVALRKEVLHFVTLGIKEGVRRWVQKEEKTAQHRGSFSSSSSAARNRNNSSAILGSVLSAGNTPISSPAFRFKKHGSSMCSHNEISEEPGEPTGQHPIEWNDAPATPTRSFRHSVSSPTRTPFALPRHVGPDSPPPVFGQTDSQRNNVQWGEFGRHEASMGAPSTSMRADTSLSQYVGSGFHSVVSVAGSLLGRHYPGEYGTDTNARFWTFLNEMNPTQESETNDNTTTVPEVASPSRVASVDGGASHEEDMEPVPVVIPAEIVFDLDEKHRFRDFRPATFRTLRMLCGITNEWYLNQLELPAKEQLTEGASNAFLFYAGDLIVKTVTSVEARVLLSILDQYREHLRNTPNSLLVRFFGLHSLTFYGKEFTFVVMRNIFPPNLVINERYDIKGSFVNRHASLPPPGKKKLCRHCSELFVVGSSDRCPEIVGLHEANVVFKDNDLIAKIRLRPEDSYEVIDALEKDSDALCSMGIMDYSLLIGIRNQQYEIDPHATIGRPSFSQSRRRGSSGHSLRPRFNSSGEVSSTLPSNTPIPHVDDPFHSPRESSVLRESGKTIGSLKLGGVTPVTDFAETAVGYKRERGLPARAVVAPATYYLGVVDILQTWSVQKRFERFAKVQLRCQDPQGLSCMEPNSYKRRFQKKVSQIIEHAIFVREVTGSWVGNRIVSEPSALLDTPHEIDEEEEEESTENDIEAH